MPGLECLSRIPGKQKGLLWPWHYSPRAFQLNLTCNEIVVEINICALHLQWVTESGASLIGNPPAMKERGACSTTCHQAWIVYPHLQGSCHLQMQLLLFLLPLQRWHTSLHLWEFETLCTVHTFWLVWFCAACKWLWIFPRQTSTPIGPPWCLWLVLRDTHQGGHQRISSVGPNHMCLLLWVQDWDCCVGCAYHTASFASLPGLYSCC